ncbi:MAG: hypothetical protein RIQ60_3546 [Pseudomonadota bacterium]|jgi:hypothetical protein
MQPHSRHRLLRALRLTLPALALWSLAASPTAALAQGSVMTFPMPANPPMGQMGTTIFPLQTAPAPLAADGQPMPAAPVSRKPAATSATNPDGANAVTAVPLNAMPVTVPVRARPERATSARNRGTQRAVVDPTPVPATPRPPAAPLDPTAELLLLTREMANLGNAGSPGSADLSQPLVLPSRVEGTIATRDDLDRYRIDLPPGVALFAGLVGHSKVADLDLYAYDDAGNLLTYSTEGPGKFDKLAVVNHSTTSFMRVYLHVLLFIGEKNNQPVRYSQTVR